MPERYSKSVQWDPVAKILIGIGLLIVVCVIAWQLGWLQALRLGRLPGDIAIENENSSVYFPITTMILLSVVFSAITWMARRFFS